MIEPKFKAGDKVKKTYTDDKTVYEISLRVFNNNRYIYKLKDVQGWKEEVNLKKAEVLW
jgi:hypothetical protein